MSPSHRRVTAQNQAEFPQDLEMCTPKLEKSYIFFLIFLICFFFACFYSMNVAFW